MTERKRGTCPNCGYVHTDTGLKRFMRRKGIRQVELAKVIGVDQPAISKEIRGESMLPEHLVAGMCKYLGIDTDRYLNGEVVEI